MGKIAGDEICARCGKENPIKELLHSRYYEECNCKEAAIVVDPATPIDPDDYDWDWLTIFKKEYLTEFVNNDAIDTKGYKDNIKKITSLADKSITGLFNEAECFNWIRKDNEKSNEKSSLFFRAALLEENYI